MFIWIIIFFFLGYFFGRRRGRKQVYSALKK